MRIQKTRNKGAALEWAMVFSAVIFAIISILLTLFLTSYSATRATKKYISADADLNQIGEYFVRFVGYSSDALSGSANTAFPTGSEGSVDAFNSSEYNIWMDNIAKQFFVRCKTDYGYTYTVESEEKSSVTIRNNYRTVGFIHSLTVKDKNGNIELYVTVKENYASWDEENGKILTSLIYSNNPQSEFEVLEWSLHPTDVDKYLDQGEQGTLDKVLSAFGLTNVVKWIGGFVSDVKVPATTYTVSFKSDENSSARTVEKGASLTLPTEADGFTKAGYHLTGWSYNGNTYAAGDSFTPTKTSTLTAVFTANTVTFLRNLPAGSTTSGTQMQGIITTFPEEPTDAEYTFTGWFTEAGYTETSNDGAQVYDPAQQEHAAFTPTKASVVLYAHWTKKATYEITYTKGTDTDGTPTGTALPEGQTKIHGTAITLGSGSFTKTVVHQNTRTLTVHANGGSNCPGSVSGNRISTYNYTSSGWVTTAGMTYSNGATLNGTRYANGATYTVNDNLALEPYFAAVTPTVTGTVTLPAAPTAPDSSVSFNGWWTASSGGTKVGNAGATVNMTSLSTNDLYAQWSVRTYTVTVNAGANGTASPAKVEGVPYGAAVVADKANNAILINKSNGELYRKVTITPATGFHIKDLTVSATTVTADASANVTFTEDLFTVSFICSSTYGKLSATSLENVPYGATITTDVTNKKVTVAKADATGGAYSQTVTIEITSVSRKLSKWTVANAGTGTTVTSNDVSVTATVSTKTFTVTIKAGTGGKVDGASSLAVKSVPYNSTITQSGDTIVIKKSSGTVFKTISFAADEGYELDSVTIPTGKVTSARTVNLSFKEKLYTLNLSAGTGGGLSKTQLTDVPYGATVTLDKTNKKITVSKTLASGGTYSQEITVTVKTGYTFTNATATTATVNGNTDFSVAFAALIYAATGNAGTGGTISTCPTDIPYGATITVNKSKGTFTIAGGTYSKTVTVSPNTGYEIASMSASSTTVEGNVTLSATFEKITYSLKINNENCTLDGATSFTLPYGSTYSISGGTITLTNSTTGAVTKVTASALDDSYSFKGYFIGSTALTGSGNVQNLSSTTITVKSDPIYYTVTLKNGGGKDSGSAKFYYKQPGETAFTSVDITFGASTNLPKTFTLRHGTQVYYGNGSNVADFNKPSIGSSASSATTITGDTTVTFTSSCLIEGTLITMADGSQKPVENVKAGDLVLVWNLKTGAYDVAPVVFNDAEPVSDYCVIYARFSDGTEVGIVSEHGFFDADLGKYVYFDENAAQYIGHRFIKYAEDGWDTVTLTEVEITSRRLAVYSPTTYEHLCIYANGMLSMPGGIAGIFNIYDVDTETMRYDAEAMASDMETYGLFTLEDFEGVVTEEMFYCWNGADLKVAIGKGILTWETVEYYANRYGPIAQEQNS